MDELRLPVGLHHPQNKGQSVFGLLVQTCREGTAAHHVQESLERLGDAVLPIAVCPLACPIALKCTQTAFSLRGVGLLPWSGRPRDTFEKSLATVLDDTKDFSYSGITYLGSLVNPNPPPPPHARVHLASQPHVLKHLSSLPGFLSHCYALHSDQRWKIADSSACCVGPVLST